MLGLVRFAWRAGCSPTAYQSVRGEGESVNADSCPKRDEPEGFLLSSAEDGRPDCKKQRGRVLRRVARARSQRGSSVCERESRAVYGWGKLVLRQHSAETPRHSRLVQTFISCSTAITNQPIEHKSLSWVDLIKSIASFPKKSARVAATRNSG